MEKETEIGNIIAVAFNFMGGRYLLYAEIASIIRDETGEIEFLDVYVTEKSAVGEICLALSSEPRATIRVGKQNWEVATKAIKAGMEPEPA